MKRSEELTPLSWDHHHGLVMARRIAKEVDGDAETLERLYSALIGFWSAGLLPHFRVEGECLLARLIRYVPPETPEARKLLDDHLAIEALVATMRDTRDLETRREALREFGETLRDHIRWEEQVLFPLTEERLTSRELGLLLGDIREYLPQLVPAPQD